MSDWYCPLPFRHAYIDSQGIAPCCKIPRQPTTLDQWSDHPFLQQIQQQFLSGQIPSQCQDCVNEEALQGRSLRTDSVRDYGDQRFQDHEIDFIDFRSVNICNFKCRSCNPVFSHGIAQDVRNNSQLQRFMRVPADTKTMTVSDQNIGWIQRNLSQLKRLMLTGGEPTVIPGIKSLIQQVAQDHPQIMIMITTNASFQDDFWFDITQRLPNLHWTVSIDAVGPAAHVVRHGTDWNRVQHNVAWLAQHAASLDINTVVSNLTVFGLRPLLQWARSMQDLSRSPQGRHGDLGCRHQFFVCARPYYLTADNWPPELQSRAVAYLDACLGLDLDPEQVSMIQGLRDRIGDSVFDPALWEKTQTYNGILNSMRNEDHSILYKEQF